MGRTGLRAVAVAAGVALAIAIGGGRAHADHDGRPFVAVANCGGAVTQQGVGGVAAGGGPKEGLGAPTNCDHFYFFFLGPE